MPAYAQQKWDLKQCIDHAIANNLTIKLQEAQREQSKVELSTAKNSFLPDLNGSASHSFNFGRSLQADNTYQSLNTQNTGLNLSTSIPLFSGLQKINNVALSKLNLQAAMEDLNKAKEDISIQQNTGLNLSTSIPLFSGLQKINNVALSKLNLQAAMEDLNKAKEDISIQVASAYLQVLFNEELVKVANEQLALSKEMLEQKTAFYKNGKASQAEWYEAKARVAQDELSAVQTENNRRLSLLDLSQLLELPSPDDFAIVSPATDSIAGLKIQTSPAEVYAEAVLTKPSVKAAQYRLEGAEKSIRMAKGAYYPQLSFGAGISTNFYNVSGMENGNFGSQLRDNFSQYIGFSLSVPIFNRFETRNRVRSARIQQHTYYWQLEESKKNLYKEIQQAYYNAVNAETQYHSSLTADEAAQASFLLMKEKYTNGKANATEYNESRTAWMKAVSDRLQAKYDYLFRTKILDFYRGIPLTL